MPGALKYDSLPARREDMQAAHSRFQVPLIRITRMLKDGEVKNYCWELFYGEPIEMTGGGDPEERTALRQAQQRATELGLGVVPVEDGGDGTWCGEFRH